MAGDKKKEKSEQIAPARMSDSSTDLPEKDIRKDGIPSVSSPSHAVSIMNRANQMPASVQGVYYPPITCYDYYYPGYNNRGYFNSAAGSYMGIQPDNASLLYYLPGYAPYTTGFLGVNGKQAPKFIQPSCSYQSEAYGAMRPAAVGPSGSGKSNGLNIAKTDNNLSNKASALPFNPRIQQPVSHFSRPVYQNHSLPLNKYTPAVNYYPSTYRYKPREAFGRSGEINAGNEMSRGPRADDRNNSSEVEQLEFGNERDEYNLQKFQTEYDSAKFYVIKSYSEDDIHKCIKYDVWSSTTNGNKKLDAAFRDADAKTSETGVKCPVFLFFSVNGSGQFVGVAEMIGPVDFSKNMDFWQLDKWNGYFPIKWHIIKDVPNTLLRHITLENNENRPVTYSRDSQEIGLEQGLEMLRIFKNHSGKTSVLDDFNFYEKREKSLKAKRNKAKQPSQISASKNGDYQKQFKGGEGEVWEQSA